MSNLTNSNFIEHRFEEYLQMGYSEHDAMAMAELDFEEAGDMADEVYPD
jgi:hypothetical protein